MIFPCYNKPVREEEREEKKEVYYEQEPIDVNNWKTEKHCIDRNMMRKKKSRSVGVMSTKNF